MYNVYSFSESIFMYDAVAGVSQFIGDEKDLIKFLSTGYRVYWNMWDSMLINDENEKKLNFYFCHSTCNVHELTNDRGDGDYLYKWFIFYDNEGRIINPFNFRREVRDYFLNKKENTDKKAVFKECKRYRREPISGIHKRKKYRNFRKIKSSSVRRIYADPEQKEFKKGKDKVITSVFYDAVYRTIERNWKSQRKTQYKIS